LPEWIYRVMDGVAVVAVLGLAAAPFLNRKQEITSTWRAGRALLVVWALLSFALVIYWVNQATGSQGRLFFPAIGATVILLVIGLEVWLRYLPKMVRRAGWSALVALLLGASLYAGAVLFPHSYAAPSALAALPTSAQPLDITFETPHGEQIRLVGIEVPSGRYQAGDVVPITLYLTTVQPLGHDYEVFVQLLDEERAEVGNVTTHPGWGRYPTSLWKAGAIYADPYDVLVRKRVDSHSPLLAQIYTGFISSKDHQLPPLPAYDSSGNEITPFVAGVVLLPWSGPEVSELGLTPLNVRFGDAIRLAGVQQAPSVTAGDALTVTLLWEAETTPASDYTAFVHLLDGNGQWVAGFDQAPGATRFPTRVWQAGDQVVGEMIVQVPPEVSPGEYSAWLGLYDANSAGAQRLPVTEADGLPTAHEMIELGKVQVMPASTEK
jgi:hypothetical protein